MSSHAEDKYEGWDKERFVEEIEDLERRLEAAEFEAENQNVDGFSDEEIRSEFFARDLGHDPADVTAMFEAFHLGRTAQAMEIAKRIACDYTGRFL